MFCGLQNDCFLILFFFSLTSFVLKQNIFFPFGSQRQSIASKAYSNLWRNFTLISAIYLFIYLLHNTGAKSSSPLPHRCPWGSSLLFSPSFAPVVSYRLLSTFAPLHERLLNCILDLFCFFTPLSPFHLLSSLHPNH